MSESETIDDDYVCSEINAFRISSRDSEESNTSKTVTSVFRFSQPSWWNEETNKMLKEEKDVVDDTTTIEEDSDGDYEVPRSCRVAKDLSLELEHKLSTTISHVGHQVWKGSLLMADYLLQHRNDLLLERTVLELGAGVGLCAIVASLCGAVKVFATDLPLSLPLLVKNCENNLCNFANNVEVSTFDVTSPPDFTNPIDFIIGADIIYDYSITDGIIDTLKKLICRNSTKCITILFSVEKRYIFTVETLDTVAPAFDYFETQLEDLKSDLFESQNIVFDIQRVNLNLYITLKLQAICYLL